MLYHVQLCLTLPPHGMWPPGSSVHGIFQARILEWVAISFSRGVFPTQGQNPLLTWPKVMDLILRFSKVMDYLSRAQWVQENIWFGKDGTQPCSKGRCLFLLLFSIPITFWLWALQLEPPMWDMRVICQKITIYLKVISYGKLSFVLLQLTAHVVGTVVSLCKRKPNPKVENQKESRKCQSVPNK